MRMDKLTIKAQEAVQQAQQLAERNQNTQIDVEHLLAALLAQTDGVTGPILQKLGVNVGLLAQQVEGRDRQISQSGRHGGRRRQPHAAPAHRRQHPRSPKPSG